MVPRFHKKEQRTLLYGLVELSLKSSMTISLREKSKSIEESLDIENRVLRERRLNFVREVLSPCSVLPVPRETISPTCPRLAFTTKVFQGCPEARSGAEAVKAEARMPKLIFWWPVLASSSTMSGEAIGSCMLPLKIPKIRSIARSRKSKNILEIPTVSYTR
jgi:hypothetical protein